MLRWLLPARTDSQTLRTGGEEEKGLCRKIRQVTASERDDAWNVIIAYEQNARLTNVATNKLAPMKIKKKLKNYKFEVENIVFGGRVKNFLISFAS